MEWSRAKNLILCILVLVNLFLLANLLYMRWAVQSISQDAVSDTVAYLDTLGIEMDPAILPEKTARKTMIVERDEAQEAQAAAILVGGEDVSKLGAGGSRYEGSRGTAVWRSGGQLDAELEPDALESTVQDKGESGAVQNARLTALFSAGFPSGLYTQTDSLLVLTQQFQGMPVYNCKLSVTTSENEKTVLSGMWTLGTALPVNDQEEMSLPGLLIQFVLNMKESGYTISCITAVESGYIAQQVSNIGIRLVPVWKITAGSVSGCISAMDASILLVE